MENRILTRLEIKSLILTTNYWLFLLFVVFRFVIIIKTIIKTLEILKEFVFDLVFESVDVCWRF